MDWRGLLDGMTATVRSTFGEPVRYFIDPEENPDDEPRLVTGIFDPDFKALEAGGTLMTTSRIPVLDVSVAEIGHEPVDGVDEVEVAGVRYRVLAAHPSSSGMTKLHLRRKG